MSKSKLMTSGLAQDRACALVKLLLIVAEQLSLSDGTRQSAMCKEYT